MVQGLALSPDGALLVSASWDKSARIWDIEPDRERQRLDHPSLVEAWRLAGTASSWRARAGYARSSGTRHPGRSNGP
ncbi:MAG: hypothetical protein LC647_15800 [Beggiatoa sp.]|nr:hypothetical protein [Beggiatoa sp.]